MIDKYSTLYTIANNIMLDPTISLLPSEILSDFAKRILRSLDSMLPGESPDLDTLISEFVVEQISEPDPEPELEQEDESEPDSESEPEPEFRLT